MSGMKIILDTDTGVDDAMAIAYAVGCPQIDLLGMTGTCGNVYLEQSIRNSRAILDMLGAPDVPVTGGLDHALASDAYVRSDVVALIHGADGIGDVAAAYGLDNPRDAYAPAGGVDFILDAARTYGRELTLVTTGPVTNAAEAIRRDPEAMRGIAGIVMMGGALLTPGNVSQAAEANIDGDPEACKELFESGIPVTMVGLDVTRRACFGKGHTQAWRDLGTRSGRAYADMVDYYIKNEPGDGTGLHETCFLHDPAAVVCALHPEWFDILELPMTCLTEGPDRGRTVCPVGKGPGVPSATRVCVGIDSAKVEQELFDTLSALFARF